MIRTSITFLLEHGQVGPWRPSGRLTAIAVTGLVILMIGAARTISVTAAQSETAAISLPPAPDIPGVIKGGTRPQLIAQGLSGADDPIWVPGVGLVFSEPNANRIVRLSEADT